MAQCVRSTLTPSRTPQSVFTRTVSAKTQAFASVSFLRTLPEFKGYPKQCSVVMSCQGKDQSQQQLSLDDLVTSNRKGEVLGTIKDSLSNCLSDTNLLETVPGLKSRIKGKVRDIYDAGDYLVLITTDRNVVIAKKCSVFPIEFVVRGYVTGSTDTSLWTVYKKGVRNYCGNALSDGSVKNQKLPANILTPTTKAEDHDVPISPTEIVEGGFMTQAEFEEASMKALSLFEFGQRVAKEHGVILVDTKYEFGKSSDGSILLIDEIHTPDSSRYWLAGSYEERFRKGLEPENVDKEFLRLWFKENCNPYEDEVLPAAPAELRVAKEHGVILVDTKYEFGKSSDGSILLIDEIHTPDSSRYWLAGSYEERFRKGLEPENVDKEFLRLWFKENCNPYEDEVLPAAPAELVTELAWRYIFLYETITGSRIDILPTQEPIHDRISRNTSQALSSLRQL
ncbi:hypothetical protein F2Q69_00037654 [Brassica cretica]|uniref:phosphoribosylaminoimidazolesuccinocarboxamide synthase n=1 Tax=Brassica cretica TaxID=69181 RepID=A0A8S9SEB5_BRACR|nr:hypothetical protein F2Q69_00037654 [Brassica cretica]